MKVTEKNPDLEHGFIQMVSRAKIILHDYCSIHRIVKQMSPGICLENHHLTVRIIFDVKKMFP